MTLALCCAVHAVQDGLLAAVYVLLPILAQTLGLNYSEVGLFKAVKSIAQGALEVASGVAAERFGERLLLFIGLAVSGLAYLALSQADAAGPVLISLLLLGIGTAFQHALASAMITNAFAAGTRRGALGLYNSSGDFGKLTFSACFSLAIGAGISWPNIALSFGLIALALAVLVWLSAHPHADDVHTTAVRATSGAGGDQIGWGILHKQSFAALWLMVFLDSMVQAGVLTFIAFLMLAKGLSLGIATMAAVAILVGGIFGKAACGFVAERLGVKVAFGLVQTLSAIGIVAVIMAGELAAYLLLPIVGLALQGSTSITYGMVNDYVHEQRASRGFALIYASSSFASVAAPIGFGLIGDHYGIETAMAAMAVATMLSIAPLPLLRPQHARSHP